MLAARYGALSADHLEYTDEAGAAAMAKAGTVAVLLPGAFYFIRETHKPPVELFRKHGVPIAIATDCNPGSSPLTSLLLTMNMAATLFRLTVDEMPRRRHARGGARARSARRGRHAGGRQVRAIWPSGTSSGWRSWSIAWGSTRCTRACGGAREPDHAAAGPCRARRLARHLSRRRGRARSGRAPAIAARCPGRRGDRRQRRAGLRHQHRLRQARQRAHRGGRSRDAAAQYRAVARGRRRRAEPRARRAADDGLEARQPGAGRLRRAPGDRGAAGGDARARPDPGGARARARSAHRATWRRSRTWRRP